MDKKNKYDFSDFTIIENVTRKEMQEVLSIMENGMIAANSKLLKHFDDGKTEIRIKGDASEIALLAKGEKKINLGKNGRVKNYQLPDYIKKNRIKLPVYFVGEWDDEEKIWLGHLSQYNPNKGKKHIQK